MESSHFWPSVLHDPLYKTFFSFWFRLPDLMKQKKKQRKSNPAILCPKFTTQNLAKKFSPWNRAIFWPSFSIWHSTKRCSYILDLGPPDAQNLLPKICTKSPISRLVWHIDWRCFGLPGGFRGWPIQWNHAKCCGADPCCHGNEIWARRGHPVAYRLVLRLSTWNEMEELTDGFSAHLKMFLCVKMIYCNKWYCCVCW